MLNYCLLPLDDLKRQAGTDLEAKYEYGQRLIWGLGVNASQEGWKYVQEAAESGHVTSKGLCALYGKNVAQDENAAFEYFAKAAQQDHPGGATRLFPFVL
jgi:TPR repeat protein